LTSVTIPDSVNEIRHDAFFACWNLKSIFIPASVHFIHKYAFCRCPEAEFTVHPDNPVYMSEHGELKHKPQPAK
jgi:hypothetical protein